MNHKIFDYIQDHCVGHFCYIKLIDGFIYEDEYVEEARQSPDFLKLGTGKLINLRWIKTIKVNK